jgi:SWI/SNF-related matrix-associated actin-dependent regulator 1 of chromatin subfamily A
MLFRRIYTDKLIAKMARDCLKEPELAGKEYQYVLEDMEVYSDFMLHSFCKKYPQTMGKYTMQKDEWMNSGKVQALSALLLRFREAGDRVLVFSQFTMVLDILEAVMETLTMQYFRLDGQTPIDERQDMIDQFYEEKDVTVFLMSTKAGGMGINLACANKVVIFDQSFNPQEDMQAENRAHRVGQQRPVEVIRLVTRGTIEEQIHALGETKLTLDERVSGTANAPVDADASKGDEDLEKRGMEIVKDMWLTGKTAVKSTGEEPKQADGAAAEQDDKEVMQPAVEGSHEDGGIHGGTVNTANQASD